MIVARCVDDDGESAAAKDAGTVLAEIKIVSPRIEYYRRARKDIGLTTAYYGFPPAGRDNGLPVEKSF